MAKILVTDDDMLIRRLLEHTLLEAGHHVFLFGSGEEALSQIEKISPDIVLVDVLMPGMDGYEVCRRLKSTYDPLIPIIMLTSLKTTEDKVLGVEAGADDFISKPFNRELLIVKISSLLKVRALQDEIRKKNHQMEDELSLAEKVQKRMLPRPYFKKDNISLSVYYHPQQYAGGDYYDYTIDPEGSFHLLFADVMGHGVASALVTAFLRGVFLSRAQGEAVTPSVLAGLVDEGLKQITDSEMYCTMIHMTIHDNVLCYVNAACPPFVVISDEGITLLHSTMPMLGILPVIPLEESVYLKNGSTILVFSDGLFEALKPDGTMINQVEALSLIEDVYRSNGPFDLAEKINEEAALRDLIINDDLTILSLHID